MITLMPLDATQNSQSIDFEVAQRGSYEFSQNDHVVFTKCAKDSIRIVVEALGLTREDEVYISTTSDSSFVSTCVTGTLFNYAKVSRVITIKTKLVFIIHEFGFKNESTEFLRIKCNELNIPLLEDCAHFFPHIGSEMGCYGDFVIHSMPKSLPTKGGGVLRIRSLNYLRETDHILPSYSDQGFRVYFERSSGQIEFLNQRRRQIYGLYLSSLGQQELFNFSKSSIPFVFGFTHKNYEAITERIEPYVELARNHVKGNILLPTNPLVDIDEYNSFIEVLKPLL